jgi:tetratricopeptide (TPR) repeat protein
MSPEQALAKRALVDHRSDVYSLGATLYEALTLQPAYPGQDREELLRQIADGDPRPPRRIDRAVPVDLETVVLKAMAREPEHRYATAQEMADDLQRFLEGRPVLASRPGLRERALRWAGRHRSAVATGAGVLMLLLAGLGAAAVVFYQQRRETEKALHEAHAQRRRTEADFRKALYRVNRMLAELDPKPNAPPPSRDELRRALIDRGLEFFRDFIDEQSTDPTVRFQSGLAYRLMASVYCSQQDVAGARAMMRKAFALLEGLVDAYPHELSYRGELIGTHYLMGLLYTSTKEPREAHEEYVRTAALYEQALRYDERPRSRNALAWFLVDCPDVSLRDPARAVELAAAAVAQEPGMAAFWNTLGIAHYRAGDWAAAVMELEKSVELQRGGEPVDWFFLAMASCRLGDRDRARHWYDKAVAWMDKQTALGEDVLRYRAEAAALLDDPPRPHK